MRPNSPEDGRSGLTAVFDFVHHRFLWLLIAAYALAVLLPEPGIAIRQYSPVSIPFLQSKPLLILLMLAFVLFNAGLSIDISDLREVSSRPSVLAAGLSAKICGPFLLVVGLGLSSRFWLDSDLFGLVIGLVLIASMPVANSSTAWSQNAGGNLAVSLGMIILTTLLSPISAPILLNLAAWSSAGGHGAALRELARTYSGTFVILWVLLPTLLGVLLHRVLGCKQTGSARSGRKLINALVLLLLNYSNAAISLPKVFTDTDVRFLAFAVLASGGCCLAAYGAGWLAGRMTRADGPQRTALLFALGMNNNGLALVLASVVMPGRPTVLLTIIVYTLIQHLVAGAVDHVQSAPSDRQLPVARE